MLGRYVCKPTSCLLGFMARVKPVKGGGINRLFFKYNIF